MKANRIGNIALRQATNFISGEPYWEIVKYYPNPHYGMIEHYEQIGDTEMYKKKDPDDWESIVSYHKSCFKNPESCYTIATLKERNEEEPDLISVGSRPLNLNKRDFEDFITLWKEVYETH